MKLRFRWGGGATWILDAGGLIVACDPVLCPKGTVHDYGLFRSTRLEAPALAPAAFTQVGLWLLTHGHRDHLDEPGIAAIGPSATVLCDASAKRRLGAREAEALEWGASRSISRGGTMARVEAVPAIHALRRPLGALVGNGNGYLVTVRANGEEARIQVTGDAVLGPELAAALTRFRPQLVIANCGAAHVGRGLLGRLIGRITMSAVDVAALARLAPDAAVVPVHHGTFDHYAEGAPPAGPGVLPVTPGSEVDLASALLRPA